MADLISEIVTELNDQQGVETVPGRRLAKDILAIVARHATAAYSRSNEIVDPDVFDEVTTEIADKAAGTFLQGYRAMRSGRDGDLEFPHAAVSHLLAVTAALRAALGYAATPTGPEVYQTAKENENAHTRGHDELRLHLLSHHGYLLAPFATDREVAAAHTAEHGAYVAGTAHAEQWLFYSDALALLLISRQIDASAQDTHLRAYRAVQARFEDGTDIPPGAVRI